MLTIRKPGRWAIISASSAVALLLIAAAAAGLLPSPAASAQAPAPGSIAISDGVAAGEVIVSWNPVNGAQGYRIGWANYRAVQQAASDGVPWTERFAYTDVRNSVDRHTVPDLAGGAQYAFIVGARHSATRHSWTDWQFHTIPDTPACPAGGTEHPPGPPSAAAPTAGTAKPTITFGDSTWPSIVIQNRIAQYIVAKGYGYPTNTKLGYTLPLFQSLQNGATDVLMEVWLPNQTEAWNKAREAGAVLSLGQSLGKDWQSAFVIPAYLQEQYPELDNVADLKDPRYKNLFATAETGGKARLVSCIIGWACEEVNAAQIAGYGLSDHIAVINPGDGYALNADLYGAYAREEPWLGYQWGTNAPALVLDLVRLEEPEYSDACWHSNKACGYQDATVLIAVNPNLPSEAPDVVQMLRNWDFNISQIYKGVARWQAANPDADDKATALWWLNNHHHIWSEWVTADAATAIHAALAAGEAAAGWPAD